MKVESEKPSKSDVISGKKSIDPSNWLDNFKEEFDESPSILSWFTYFSYVLLFFVGILRDFARRIGVEKTHIATDSPLNKDFNPLYVDYDSFYERNLYRRIRDCWDRPLASAPSVHTLHLERISDDFGWTFQITGRKLPMINLASYNYLGFAGEMPTCLEAGRTSMKTYGLVTGGPRHELGNFDYHSTLERMVATYVGTEDALCFGQGFASNAYSIPCLVGTGSLIVSDVLNHKSIAHGAKLSGASVKVFEHNNTVDLERVLRDAITKRLSSSGEPYKKILIIVEGIYSMEGSILKLPEIVRIKNKYKCYLYVDEAHSIGAVGPRGRGVCDHFGVAPGDVDVMMGTFSKSFSAAGGYIAGSRKLVKYLRARTATFAYAASISPPVATQIMTTMRIIMGELCYPLGPERVDQLRQNTVYFRTRLKQLGFNIYGNDYSPVVPLMLFVPCKIGAFSRECLARGLAVVSVGFPATHVLKGRVRLCLSAGLTHQDLDKAIDIINEVGDLLILKYNKHKSHLYSL